jgi:DNA modification methylase
VLNTMPQPWDRQPGETTLWYSRFEPVELAVPALEYSSRPGENVLDLFGGSGSTLIAAEQTGRPAFLMERDPLYCDVIVARYQQFTGRKAERSAG